MSTNRSCPIPIGKFPETVQSAGIVDSSTSPRRSPLDCDINSPRGQKTYNQQGRIGLGIVVALTNNSNNSKGEILAKYGLYGQYSNRSSSIPISSSSYNESVDDMLEDEFTYVTCHGPNKDNVTTRVYCDGGDYDRVIKREISENIGGFKISSPPEMLFDDHCGRSDSDLDFLSSCHLCRKTLHGKDIYMYRGEKAFCSEECRQNQICIDERKEQCRSEVSRSSSSSSSSYYSSQIIAI